MRYIGILLLLIVFYSCKDSNKDKVVRLVKEWEGKEIIFPSNIIFTKYGKDTLDYQIPESNYTIVSYIDSMGCTSCKLQFHRWKNIMHEMDSVTGYSIPHLFIFHPKNRRDLSELNHLMNRDKFEYPVWIDIEDVFNKQNKLPTENIFHTLLINKQNKVVAIGNPFQNPQIRELYLKIISNNRVHNHTSIFLTKVTVGQSVINMGEFDWAIPQKVVFTLKNSGNERLVINDITSSCGCISVDYLRTPVEPGKEIHINVTYKAEKPEYLNKTLTIYANIETPLQITIKGNAQ